MVKHTQIIRRLFPTNCLSVFNHFVGLALKGLISFVISWNESILNMWYCMGNTSQNSLTGSNDREWFWKEKKKFVEMKVFCQKLSFFKWSCMYCNKNARTHELHLLRLLLWNIENGNKRRFKKFQRRIYSNFLKNHCTKNEVFH